MPTINYLISIQRRRHDRKRDKTYVVIKYCYMDPLPMGKEKVLVSCERNLNFVCIFYLFKNNFKILLPSYPRSSMLSYDGIYILIQQMLILRYDCFSNRMCSL